MNDLDPTLDDLRSRLSQCEGGLQKRSEIERAVSEVTAQLDVELDRAVVGMSTQPIAHPVIAANHDVRNLLWCTCGFGSLTEVANKRAPVLTRPLVVEADVSAYNAEVSRLAVLASEILGKRL